MSAKLDVKLEFHVEHCTCGGTYAINEEYRARRYKMGGGWHCPYCCTSWGYFDGNENTRLKKQLAEETERKNRALAEANALRVTADEQRTLACNAVAEAERLKNRAKHGVCPCCSRSFANLRNHIATKHPDFNKKSAKQPPKKRSSYVETRLAEIKGKP